MADADAAERIVLVLGLGGGGDDDGAERLGEAERALDDEPARIAAADVADEAAIEPDEARFEARDQVAPDPARREAAERERKALDRAGLGEALGRFEAVALVGADFDDDSVEGNAVAAGGADDVAEDAVGGFAAGMDGDDQQRLGAPETAAA